MNHLAALLNVITDIDIPKKLSHEIFESYLGQFFQLVGDKDDMKVSDQDFEHMQEIAFALGISEKEFEKIMTEEEEEQKEETKEKDKKKMLNKIVRENTLISFIIYSFIYCFYQFWNKHKRSISLYL